MYLLNVEKNRYRVGKHPLIWGGVVGSVWSVGGGGEETYEAFKLF